VSENALGSISRRELLKNSSRVAVASALAGVAIPSVHASDDSTIRLALVGCGGRGTGAAANAMSSKSGPTRLVAMADVFDDRLQTSYQSIKLRFDKQVDVPEDQKFIGFEAYKQAMDCLRPGDVVILTTPPAFRWVHFTYAIERGLNVFMEKPVAVDAPTGRRMLKLAEEAKKKNLKVGVGLMCRHCVARQELFDRIRADQMGELLMLRAYRLAGPTGSAFVERKPEGMSELLYQIRHFHAFLWLSGGAFSDFLIHNIDECCWMKDAWPVKANGFGGRHYRGDYVDQNFDVYSVEYTYGDGTKLFIDGRCIAGCHQEFASYAHGTKSAAVISFAGHAPSRCRIQNAQTFSRKDIAWRYSKPEPSPYQTEWDDLITAIRQGKDYNEVPRGAEASIVTAMGRMAAHTGQIVTREDMRTLDHEFAPHVDKLALDSASPLVADSDGRYPVPQPGIVTRREYQV